MVIAPPLSIRAGRQLALHLVDDMHPLAVAAVVMSKEGFVHFAGMIGRDLSHPMLTPFLRDNAEARRALEWFRKTLSTHFASVIEACCKGEALQPQPPRRESEMSLAYCPRCLAQFKRPSGVCPDCRSVALIPFEGSVPTETETPGA